MVSRACRSPRTSSAARPARPAPRRPARRRSRPGRPWRSRRRRRSASARSSSPAGFSTKPRWPEAPVNCIGPSAAVHAKRRGPVGVDHLMCRTAPFFSLSQKQPDGSKDRFFASPDQVCSLFHHRPGASARPRPWPAARRWSPFRSPRSRPRTCRSPRRARRRPAGPRRPEPRRSAIFIAQSP